MSNDGLTDMGIENYPAISRNTSVGGMLGEWRSRVNILRYCIKAVDGVGYGDAYNLYSGLKKPDSVFAAPGIPSITDDGLTYTVWTNPDLQAIGLGYIIRWRVKGQYRPDTVGEWVTPPANWDDIWMPPASMGVPFWKVGFVNTPFNTSINSLQDWWDIAVPWINATSPPRRFIFDPLMEISLRYVLIKPHSQLADQLDRIITPFPYTELGITHNRPGGVGGTGSVGGNRKYKVIPSGSYFIQPKGTCTTPSAQEATIHFGMVYQNAFPDVVGSYALQSSRKFTLTLRDCPRTNIQYYFHANGKWVDSNKGVVGLSDSTPGSNPRRFGVELQQRPQSTSQYHEVTIYPHEMNPPPMWKYSLWWQGEGTVDTATGITYTIPMQAALVRTATGEITPGPFTAAVVFVISYP